MHDIIQSEVKDLFNKFRSLRDETNKQFSIIIGAHSETISNGITELVQEVSKLQTHVSVITSERNILLETIANLNGEIRMLNAKLPNVTQETEEIHDRDTQYLIDSEEEAPDTEEINIITQEEEVVEFGDEKDHNGATQVVDESEGETTPVGNTMHEAEEIHNQADQDVENFKEDTPYTHDHFVEGAKIKSESFDEEDSVCKECNFTFSTTENLTIHLKNFHSDLNASREDPGELGTPIGNSRGVKSKTSCQECGNAFLNLWHLEQHRESVHKQGDTTYKCKECPYLSYKKKKLDYHMISAHGKGGKKFNCKKCSYSSASRRNFERHNNGVHKNIRNHKCEECGNAFLSKGDLNRHRDSVHKMGDQKFKCEQCPYSTFCKYNLNRHTEEVHEKIKKHFCKECGYGSYQKTCLDYHMVTTHGKGGKKLKCKKCSYSSVSKNHLMSHNDAVHEKIKNHACSECDYAAYRKKDLKRHMESVHRVGDKK